MFTRTALLLYFLLIATSAVASPTPFTASNAAALEVKRDAAEPVLDHMMVKREGEDNYDYDDKFDKFDGGYDGGKFGGGYGGGYGGKGNFENFGYENANGYNGYGGHNNFEKSHGAQEFDKKFGKFGDNKKYRYSDLYSKGYDHKSGYDNGSKKGFEEKNSFGKFGKVNGYGSYGRLGGSNGYEGYGGFGANEGDGSFGNFGGYGIGYY